MRLITGRLEANFRNHRHASGLVNCPRGLWTSWAEGTVPVDRVGFGLGGPKEPSPWTAGGPKEPSPVDRGRAEGTVPVDREWAERTVPVDCGWTEWQ